MNTLPSELVKEIMFYLANDDIINCSQVFPNVNMFANENSDVWREIYRRYTDWALPEGYTYKHMALWWHNAPFRIAEQFLPGLKDRVIRRASREVGPLYNKVEYILTLQPWSFDLRPLISMYESECEILAHHQGTAQELYKYYPNEATVCRFAYASYTGRTYRPAIHGELQQMMDTL